MEKNAKSIAVEGEQLLLSKLNAATNKSLKSTSSARRKQMRTRLWPALDEDELWLRTKSVGFTTIPRTLTLINRILDTHAGKGFPVSSTYLALWCQVFDEAFVEIRNPKELAHESGFGGARAEATWKSRMKKLVELGVIDSKPGVYGDYQYVLMLNPLHAIEKIYKNDQSDMLFQSLLSRMMQVGATDIKI
jgi:hypothetical protein